MKYIAIHTLVFAVLLAPLFVFAEDGGLTNPIKYDSLGAFLVALLGLITKIVFPIIVLFIVYIGFRFVQASATGNADKLKEFRGYFVWAIVGALIVLGAQALSFAIQATVGQLSS